MPTGTFKLIDCDIKRNLEMEITGFLIGLVAGAVLGFLTVGVFFWVKYLKVVAQITTLQATVAAKAGEIIKEQAIKLATNSLTRTKK